jgi:hypothetical protein
MKMVQHSRPVASRLKFGVHFRFDHLISSNNYQVDHKLARDVVIHDIDSLRVLSVTSGEHKSENLM